MRRRRNPTCFSLVSRPRLKPLLIAFLTLICAFVLWSEFKFYLQRKIQSDLLNKGTVTIYIQKANNKVIKPVAIVPRRRSTGATTTQTSTTTATGTIGTTTASNKEPTCRIPVTPIFPPYFSTWKPSNYAQDCSSEKKLFRLTNSTVEILPIFVNGSRVPCCLQEIQRGSNDSSYSLKECEPLKSGEDLGDKEAILVQCGKETNVDANIPIKKEVQEKINYWEGVAEEERPFSVFILGIDTVSRSHAFRSLPETLKIMKRLNFFDFEAYHSIAASTLTNFMALLFGQTRAEVRSSCAKDWASPFDDCPFVWKNFSESNYVTGYLEDGFQTFNWGGQSGFIEQPTDYYLHHLFQALEAIRNNQTVISKKPGETTKKPLVESRVMCASEQTVPEFMLRYGTKFLQKFAENPFFFMTWFGYPFHEDMYSLANFDKELADLFRLIESQPSILRKSLIIFVSDHGDRMSFFNSRSVESFIERGLPPLFIRLPDQMTENYPEIAEAMRLNTKILTSPFDIHHTLLHILSLNSNLDLVSRSFDPELPDRSSLFTRIPLDRNCSQVNIRPTDCLCNVQYNQSVANDQRKNKLDQGFANKILTFALNHLNSKVEGSKYKQVCSVWKSVSPKDIIYTRLISYTKAAKEVLIAFTANPGEAKFEARLTIHLGFGRQDFLKFTEVVGISRNNRYGDQSWCIPSVSDEDKKMKELCMCKEQRNL